MTADGNNNFPLFVPVLFVPNVTLCLAVLVSDYDSKNELGNGIGSTKNR